VVQSVLDVEGFGSLEAFLVSLLVLLCLLSLFLKTFFLVFSGLRGIL